MAPKGLHAPKSFERRGFRARGRARRAWHADGYLASGNHERRKTNAMALRSLFRSARGRQVPVADAANREGAPAYSLSPKHALAQMVSTACMAGTFYASAQEQIETLLRLAAGIEPDFVAKAALHARSRG